MAGGGTHSALGNEFTGEHKYGIKSGRGEMIFLTGDSYTGLWSDVRWARERAASAAGRAHRRLRDGRTGAFGGVVRVAR